MHVASVELLHQHQEGTANESEDERGDVGVGEVFANVNEGLVERASCLWAPTASSPTTPTTGWLAGPVKGYRQCSWRHQSRIQTLIGNTMPFPTTLSQRAHQELMLGQEC